MAGEGDAERLVVLLEARVSDFEKRMAKAEGTATKSYMRMRTGSRSATRQMEADMVRSTGRINQALAVTSTRMGAFARAGLGGLTAGVVGTLAPLLSLTAALNTARRALDDFGKLDDQAKMLGVNVERLQEFHYAATQAGMAADNFDMGLRRMTRRAAEAAQGTGAAKEAFKELGIELVDQNGKLKANDDLLREVADALQKVPSHADRLRLAFKMFDTDGAKMLAVLEGGSARLDEFAQKAQQLGLVVDRELIEKSAQLGDELETATKIMDLNFKQAMVDLAPVLVEAARLAASVAGAIREIADAMREVEQKSTNALTGKLADLAAQRRALESSIAGKRGAALDNTGLSPAIVSGTVDPITRANLEATRQELAEVIRQEREINGILDARKSTVTEIRRVVEDDGGSGGAPLGLGNVAAAIEPLDIGIGKITEAVQELDAVSQVLATTLSDGLSNAVLALVRGESAVDALINAFDSLAEQLLRMAMDQMIQALFGNIMGAVGGMGGGLPLGRPGSFSIGGMGLYDTGTANTGGRRGEVRGIVHGQEAVIPLPSGGKVPVQIIHAPAQQGTSDQRVHVTVGISTDGNGNIRPFVEHIANERVSRFSKQELLGRLQQIQRNPRRQG